MSEPFSSSAFLPVTITGIARRFSAPHAREKNFALPSGAPVRRRKTQKARKRAAQDAFSGQISCRPPQRLELMLIIRERERERERESLTYQTNTSNADSFSLISYTYRKIPEPEPNRFYRLFSSVTYPFSYPFFASRLSFPQEYTVVIENKIFSEKTLLFSDLLLSFFPRTELLLTMRPTWSAGVFFIYGPVLLPSAPDELPRIRAPPLPAPYFGQTPEPPRRCLSGYA